MGHRARGHVGGAVEDHPGQEGGHGPAHDRLDRVGGAGELAGLRRDVDGQGIGVGVTAAWVDVAVHAGGQLGGRLSGGVAVGLVVLPDQLVGAGDRGGVGGGLDGALMRLPSGDIDGEAGDAQEDGNGEGRVDQHAAGLILRKAGHAIRSLRRVSHGMVPLTSSIRGASREPPRSITE